MNKRTIRRRNKRMVALICGLLLAMFLLALAGSFIYDAALSNNLTKYRKLTTGTVTGFSGGNRGGGGTLYFVYEVDGRSYEKHGLLDKQYASRGPELIGKIFPVAYDSTNKGNSSMLVTPGDFERYSLPFPDRLEGVKPSGQTPFSIEIWNSNYSMAYTKYYRVGPDSLSVVFINGLVDGPDTLLLFGKRLDNLERWQYYEYLASHDPDTLQAAYINRHVEDGEQKQILFKYRGTDKLVRLSNYYHKGLADLYEVVNSMVPGKHMIRYTGMEKRY